MLQHVRAGLVGGAATFAVAGCVLIAQQNGASMPPINDAPNPYQTIENHFKMPTGREWGSTSAVDIDKDGRTIWVAERCQANLCWDAEKGAMSPLDPVLHFNPDGTLIKSFGAGMIVWPHGIHVDSDGNIWIADAQDNMPRRAPGAPADAPLPAAPAKVMGHQVFKFSPEGKLLLTLGKPGGNRPGETFDPASFYQPNDVITYPNGDILVTEGHSDAPTASQRLIRFDRNGKFLREFGKRGSGRDGEFMQPHALAFDSKGRLFVADRSNNRVLILDPETFQTLDVWYQFSRLSGIFIDKDDIFYGADSESGSVNPPHGAWMRGIRIGSIADGKVTAFIPDPTSIGEKFAMVDGKPVMTKADGSPGSRGTLAAEGVAVDADGNIYGAEVGPRAVKKYVKK